MKNAIIGNKAATFPLQLLGFEVDPLNTVQFSNHTGYPTFTGDRLEGSQIEALAKGLEVNGILGAYSHVLTGYVGRESALNAVYDLILKLKSINPNIVIFVDTVMGDEGKLYVPQELVPIYRDKLCSVANVVTPNGFEAELLSSIKITSTQTALEALQSIHSLGPKIVVITSMTLPDRATTGPTLHLLASIQTPSQTERFLISFPKRSVSFTGTGDLLAALLLANLSRAGVFGGEAIGKVGAGGAGSERSAFRGAVERAVASMQSVIGVTVEEMVKAGWGGVEEGRGKGKVGGRELVVVGGRDGIEEPDVWFHAEEF
ncbi:hypothetical protein HDU97_008704 [Phlyctochytrium planicorne]|nr:hypothetical protein HDU97_008704 [Phlyctochytrium planicorne]